MTLFLSAGHGTAGGHDKPTVVDPGALSVLTLRELGLGDSDSRLTEYSFTHTVIEPLIVELKALRIPVVRVPDDLKLLDRIRWVKTEAAKYKSWTAMQIHANASTRQQVRGMEMIVGPNAPKPLVAAASWIVQETSALVGTPDRGVKTDESIGRKIAWVRHLPCGVLWEVGFITNPKDAKMLARLMTSPATIREIAVIIARVVTDGYGLQDQGRPAP